MNTTFAEDSIFVYTHARANTRTHAHSNMRAHTRAHTHARTHAHTHITHTHTHIFDTIQCGGITRGVRRENKSKVTERKETDPLRTTARQHCQTHARAPGTTPQDTTNRLHSENKGIIKLKTKIINFTTPNETLESFLCERCLKVLAPYLATEIQITERQFGTAPNLKGRPLLTAPSMRQKGLASHRQATACTLGSCGSA